MIAVDSPPVVPDIVQGDVIETQGNADSALLTASLYSDTAAL